MSLPGDPQVRSAIEGLAWRYRFRNLLGRGGFGHVLLMEDRELERPVAVKLLSATVESGESRARFTREAEVTAQLRHPCIVTLYDHGWLPSGAPYIVYEYVEGEDLADRMASGEAPEIPLLERIAAGIGEALALGHEAGVLHRDVKPENVLLRPSGEPVLCDFGAALVVGSKTRLTAEGLVLGTPAYMAPELWRGEDPTPASDQFAWAASLHALWTGELVYGSRDPAAVLRAIEGQAPLGPRRDQPGPWPSWNPTLRRAMTRDPMLRYSDMEAFLKALQGTEGEHGEASEVMTRLHRASPRPGTPTSGATAPTRQEASTTARSRYVAAAAMVMAIFGLALVSLGDPPPHSRLPADATPPPHEGPEARALGATLDALTDQLGGSPEALLTSDPSTRPALRQGLLAPSFEPHWRNAMEAAGTWILETAGTDEARESEMGKRLAKIMPAIAREVHLLVLTLTAADPLARMAGRLGFYRPRGGAPGEGTPQASPEPDEAEAIGLLRHFLQEDLDRLRSRVQAVLPRHPIGLRTVATTLAELELPETLSLLPLLDTALARASSPDERRVWRDAIRSALACCADTGRLSYEERLAQIERLRPSGPIGDSPRGRARSAEALATVARLLFRAAFQHEDVVDDRLWARLHATLSELDPLIPDAPQAVATELERAMASDRTRELLVGANLDEAEEALLERVTRAKALSHQGPAP